MIIIEYLATTKSSISFVATIWDKAKHTFAFFVLMLLLNSAYPTTALRKKALYLLFFGVQIELVQSLIPYRDFSLLDIFADLIGIVLAITILIIRNSLSKLLSTKS